MSRLTEDKPKVFELEHMPFLARACCGHDEFLSSTLAVVDTDRS